MNFIISSKQVTLTPQHKAYIEEKLALLEKFDPAIRQIRIECDADKKERDGKKFRIMVWIVGSAQYKAGIQEATLYTAIDAIVPLLKRVITKSRKKTRDLHRPSRI